MTDQQNSTSEQDWSHWIERPIFVVAVVLFAIALAAIWLLKAVTGYPKFVVALRL